MTPIAVRCPECSAVLKLPHQGTGPLKVKCPECNAKSEVTPPEPTESPSVEMATITRPVPRRFESPSAASAGKAAAAGWWLAGVAALVVAGTLVLGCVGIGIWGFMGPGGKKPVDEQPIAQLPSKKDPVGGKEIGADDVQTPPKPKIDDEPDSGSDFSRLAKRVNHTDPEVCAAVRNALRAYAQLSKKNQVPALEREDVGALVSLLKSSDDTDLQAFAVAEMTRLGPQADQAVPALVELARDSRDPTVLASALAALTTIGVRSEETLNVFEKYLDHPTAGVRDQAALALLQLGPERLQLNRVTELMARPNDEVRVAATRVLRQKLAAVTAKDLPALREGLKNPQREVRLAYIDAIGSLKDDGRDAAPELTLLLASTDAEISAQAIRALDNMGKLLEVARTNGDPAILKASLGALKTKGVKTDESLTVYQKHLDHADDGVKTSAALALVDLGPERLTTERLIDLMGSPSDDLRTSAGKLLRKKLAGLTRQDMPALRQGLKSPVREVRLAFLSALGAIKGASAEALPELMPLLTSPDKEIAIQACLSLETTGKAGDKAVPALVKAMELSDKPVARAATLALFKIDPANDILKTKGVPLLVADLQPDIRDLKAFLAKPVSGKAALAIVEMGDAAVEPVVKHLLINNDPKKLRGDEQVQGTAARLLGYELLKEFAKRAKANGDRSLAAALKKHENRLQFYFEPTEAKLAAQAKFLPDLTPETRQLYAHAAVSAAQAHRATGAVRIP